MNKLPIRNSVRVILLNDKKEILMMCINDLNSRSLEAEYTGRFCTLVGGKIECNETLETAAIREIWEESGILKEHITLGPAVWYGEFNLILYGQPCHIQEKYIVASTRQSSISLNQLTTEESKVVVKLSWFSLAQITNCTDTMYPIILPKLLPDIVAGQYPKKVIKVN